MTFTVNIDTLKIQIEFYNSNDQRNVMSNIIHALQSSYNYLHIEYNSNDNCNFKSGLLVHSIHTAGTKILELKSASYLSGNHKDKNRVPIYYISIELAGLKRYDEKIDFISHSCLLRVCAYLNTHNLRFFYTGIDICVDMNIPFIYCYSFCNKRSSGVRYYKVNEVQPYFNTHYIEKYNNTHHHVMRRAYIYDKGKKENNINLNLTRFELKLQSRFFNVNSYNENLLSTQLDKYHILYFPTLEEKEAAIELYGAVEANIRRRDLHRLGLDRYRVIPDTKEIEYFLFSLYNIYESDLCFIVNDRGNGFNF